MPDPSSIRTMFQWACRRGRFTRGPLLLGATLLALGSGCSDDDVGSGTGGGGNEGAASGHSGGVGGRPRDSGGAAGQRLSESGEPSAGGRPSLVAAAGAAFGGSGEEGGRFTNPGAGAAGE